MLAYHGFVIQDEASKEYLPGPELIEVGLAVVQHMDIRRVTRPLLVELAAETGETVHLITVQGTTAHFIDGVESDRALRAGLRIGVTLPAHSTSGGKAVLAELPLEEVKRRYPRANLPEGTTNHSMKTRPELLVQLERIREMGYAINDQETESDLRAVGVALHVIGAPVAAIAVAAPAARMDIELARKYGERLRQRLAELEGSLGHTRGPG